MKKNYCAEPIPTIMLSDIPKTEIMEWGKLLDCKRTLLEYIPFVGIKVYRKRLARESMRRYSNIVSASRKLG